jgi:diketogulonate reductase-like aldo/keto reductase
MHNQYKILNNGVKIPVLGFGTYRLLPGVETRNAVYEAVKAGYRHIDTAESYDNESSVGFAVAKCISEGLITRDKLFITTKISAHNPIGYDNTLYAFEGSIQRLGLDYVDLYLIHWPNMTPDDTWKSLNADTWRAFEKLYFDGRIKAIGISNFMIHHITSLIDSATVMPMINQLELNPQWQQREVVQFCNEQKIICEAWMPLMRGLQKPFITETSYKIISYIASECKKTLAQICLRWSIQKGFIPLVKSKDPDRMVENQHLFDFELSSQQVHILDTLNGTISSQDATPDTIRHIWSLYEKVSALQKDRQIFFRFFGLIPFLKISFIENQKIIETYFLFKRIALFQKISEKNWSTLYFLCFIPIMRKKLTYQPAMIKRMLPVSAPPTHMGQEIKAISFQNRIFDCAVEFNRQRECMPFRFHHNERLQRILLKFRFQIMRKVYIPHLDVRITTHCTLKCRDCSHIIPYIANDVQYNTTFSEFKSDFNMLLPNIDRILCLNILGGETLLNINLPEIIAYVSSKPQILNVCLFTNGTVLPSDRLVNALRKYKKVFVQISDYSCNYKLRDSLHINELQKIFNDNQISYYIEKYSTWCRPPRIIKSQDKYIDKYVLSNTFSRCSQKMCTILWKGKLYPCVRVPYIDTLQEYKLCDGDYIDLYNTANLPCAIIEFYKKSFYKVCGYCDINGIHNEVYPALQI